MKNLKLSFALIAIIVLSFISTLSLAQTQRITHKSHSGKMSNFVVNANNKNNLGEYSYPETDYFFELKQDSVALIHYLQDSSTGKKILKMLKKAETKEEFLELREADEQLIEETGFSKSSWDINKSIIFFDYEPTKTYILELLERHKNDKKENSSGNIFFNPKNYQNYAFLSFFLGMLGLAGWLYKESKTVLE